jgi:hypothetical protein
MADKTVILRPQGPLHGRGGWTAVNGHTGNTNGSDADLVTWLSDRDDSTYAESPIGNTGALDLHFSTFQFPARSQIRWVRPVLRTAGIRETDGVVRLDYRLAYGTGIPGESPDLRHPTLGGVDVYMNPATRVLQTFTTSHRGDAWTQDDIDRIRLLVWRAFDWDRDRPKISDEWLEVAYNEAPVWAFTGPADQDPNVAGRQVIDTSNPTITGTYSDPNGDRKERHHARVWPEAEYTKVGFRVEAPSPSNPGMRNRPPGEVWGEGPILSEGTSFKAGTPLPNGKYRAYVAVADVGWVEAPRYSALADGTLPFIEWTQAVPAPPAPSLVVSSDVANGRLLATVTAPADVNAQPSFVRLEESDDGGATWRFSRWGERVDITPGGSVAIPDYDAPPNTVRIYRARSGRVFEGQELVSSASPQVDGTLVLDSWWLLDPLDPATRMRVVCFRGRGDTAMEMTSTEQQAEFEVIGSPYSVTLSGAVQGERWDHTFTFASRAELAAFEQLRRAQRVLLLKNQHGQGTDAQWYVRIGKDRRKAALVTAGFPAQPSYRVSVELSERERP